MASSHLAHFGQQTFLEPSLVALGHYGQQVYAPPPECVSPTVAQTADLWLKIDQLHLNFLKAEESTKKIDIRRKLEEYIQQYLCLVPQERKFCNTLTTDIISDSIRYKPNFSALKAGQAFVALEKFAANLLNQPWRKEFKEIKQFGGFYTHNVESALHGAERMFYEMGYQSGGHETLVLEGPIDQDKVTIVARDCILAFVECQIISIIIQGVSAEHSCSCGEAFSFRREHIATPEQAIRSILYSKNQGEFQTSVIGLLPSIPRPGYFASQNVRTSLSYQAPSGHQTNGGFRQPATAQLIDVGDGDDVDGSRIPLTIKHLEEEHRRRSLIQPLSATNGSEASWDYVYSQLERIGYTKDQSERPDVLALLSRVHGARNLQSESVPKMLSAEEEQLLRQLRKTHLDEKGQAAVEEEDEPDAVHRRFRRNSGEGQQSRDTQRSRVEDHRRSLRHSRPLEPPPLSIVPKEADGVPLQVEPKWECYACTFANGSRVEICEMCGKSRNSPDLLSACSTPSGTGGAGEASRAGGISGTESSGEEQEGVSCQKCTLVNARKRKVCEACGASLKR